MKKRIQSFGHAFRGIRMVFGSEINMMIHLAVATLVIAFGILLQISLIEWLICILCFGLVISAEMFNTSIETFIDMVSPEHHPLAGKAKDIAAGAVLVSAIAAATIGLIIFVPKLLLLLAVNS